MKQTLKIFGTGFTMGTADLIPGVSGGTIAFISGIYEKLLESIAAFDLSTLQLFFSGRWKQLWQKINGPFLVTLFIGIISAILLMAQLMEYLLASFPHLVKSFFLGIILSSVVILALPYKKIRKKYRLFVLIGIALGALLTTSTFSLGAGLLSLLIAGMLASVAMILPGISGSYILLILDKYELILGIVVRITNIIQQGAWQELFTGGIHSPGGLLLLFVVGVAIGLICFAKLLTYILHKRHTPTVLLLLGLMVGALPSVWPRQDIASPTLAAHILIVTWIGVGIVTVAGLHARFYSKQKKA